MKHSDSLHRVCFIHLYIAICVASRILSLIAWAIVKRWKEFGIKQVRICKTHSFSHWTRWIQTIVELSGAHFERVVRHISCCFKMCQNMSTFFSNMKHMKRIEKTPWTLLAWALLDQSFPFCPLWLFHPAHGSSRLIARRWMSVLYISLPISPIFLRQKSFTYMTHMILILWRHMKSYDIYDQLAVTFTTWESETLNSECILQLGKRLASHELHTSLSLIPQHSVWNLQWASKDLVMLML